MTTLIRNARVLTLDSENSEYLAADILVRGTEIAAIGPDLQVPARESPQVLDASGLLAMPGLINAHFHSPGSFLRGVLESRPLEIFMLHEVPPFATSQSPRLHYIRTMLGNLEMLKRGITAVQDDAYFLPLPSVDAIDGVLQAHADSGIRATVALDQPNVPESDKYPFLRDLLPTELRDRLDTASRVPTSELIGYYEHLIRRWHGAEEGRLRAAVSVSAPQRVTEEYFGRLHDFSRQLDLPLVVHVLETKLQRVLGQEKFGKSLVRYVNDLGFLDARTLVVHAIWVDDEDMDLLGESGCSVAHNPICNLRLGSGVMPFRRLRVRGVPVCLGSDEICSNDGVNLWWTAKMAALIHTLADPDYNTWPTAAEILEAATTAGARAMRVRTGMLAPGHLADLILVDLNALAFTPLSDLRRQLVFSEDGSAVVLTMVAGRVVAERGRVLTVDEEAIKAEARELVQRHGPEIALAAKVAGELEPYYREMYMRSARTDVGMNRWLELS